MALDGAIRFLIIERPANESAENKIEKCKYRGWKRPGKLEDEQDGQTGVALYTPLSLAEQILSR